MADAAHIAAAIEQLADAARAKGITHLTVEVDGIGPVSMALAPQAPPVQNAPKPKQPGPAERMLKRHEILFAASSVKPRLHTPDPPPSTVPRAVRAKEAAARRGGDEG